MPIEEILKRIKTIISTNEDFKDSEANDDILDLVEIYADHNKLNKNIELSQDLPLRKRFERESSKEMTLETLIVEMIRPQIQLWLDKHLATIVKQVVETEIKNNSEKHIL
jgi:cell pole-organizing protein PopZ